MKEHKPNRARHADRQQANRQSHPVHRTLNVRLLVVSLGAVVLLTTGAHFWRQYQIRRTAGALLERAEALEEAGQRGAATNYLHRYLQLFPDEPHANLRMANLMLESTHNLAQRDQAAEACYAALAKVSMAQRPALRVKLGQVLIDMQRYAAARQEVATLKREATDLPDAARKAVLADASRLAALAAYGSAMLSGRDDHEPGEPALVDRFEEAIEQKPGDVALATILARIYRQQTHLLDEPHQAIDAAELAKLADRVIDRMVAENPEGFDALLARAGYRAAYDIAGTDDDLREAFRRAPASLAVRLTAADFHRREAIEAHRRGEPGLAIERWEDACRDYQRVISDSDARKQGESLAFLPEELAAYYGLARSLVARGQHDRAAAICRQGIEVAPEQGLGLRFVLVESLGALGKLAELRQELDLLDDRLKQLAPMASRSPELLAEHQSMARSASLLRAKWHLAEGRTPEAITLLEDATLGPRGSAFEVAQSIEAYQLLGKAHAAAGDWEQAAAAHKNAAALDSHAVGPLQAAANASLRGKRFDEALGMALRAQAVDNSPSAGLLVARVLLFMQAARPVDARSWQAFETAMSEAEAGHGAQMATARAQPAGFAAQQWLLQSARGALQDDQPRSPTETIDAALESMRTMPIGQPSSFGMAWGELSLLADVAPKNLRLLAMRMEMALIARAMAGADAAQGWSTQSEQLEEQIKSLEGELTGQPDSAVGWRYYRARRLMATAANAEAAELVEAAQLVEAVRRLQPEWTAARMLEGQVCDASGRRNEALTAYADALRQGRSDPPLFARFAALLRQLGRFDPEQEPLTTIDQAETRLRLGVAMLREAERAESPDDENRAIRSLALEQFRAAVELAEESDARFRAADAVLGYHAAHDTPEQLQTAVDQFQSDQRFSPAEQCLLAAQSHERLGQLDEAEVQYRRAAELNPDDQQASLQLARFLLRDAQPEGIEEANVVLTGVLERHPDLAPAREMLALLLASQDGDAQWQRVEELLARPREGQADASAEQRLLAMLLVRRGGSDNLGQAQQLLEKLVAEAPGYTDIDRLLLAGLYARKGMIHAAEEQYLKLVRRPRPTAEALAEYVGLLLGQGETARAVPWLEQLEKWAPDQWRTAVLRARWRYVRQESDEIEPLLEPVAEQKFAEAAPANDASAEDATVAERANRRQARFAHAVGRTYLGLARWDAAERWLQRAVEVDMAGDESREPDHLLAYVELLLDREKHEPATQWLKELDQIDSDGLGTLAAKARWLTQRDEAGEIEPMIEPVAERLWEASGDNEQRQGRLALDIGMIYLREQRNEAAERWFRRASQLSPEAYEALAVTLARQGRHADAIRLCAHAAAPQPAAETDEANSAAAAKPDPRTLRPVMVLTSALLEGAPSEEALAEAEPLLDAALGQFPHHPALLFNVANVRIVQHRVPDAIALYEHLLELDPSHLMARNNLATMLGDLPDRRADALSHIDQAIRQAGPMPRLLNTKGAILVRGGSEAEVEQGVRLLEEAAAAPNPDPRYFFHLAEVYLRLQRTADASQALQNALDGGLTTRILTEADRESLASLQKQLLP